MRKSILFLLGVVFLTELKSQDLTGSWHGIFHSDLDGHGRRRTLEMNMELNETGRKVTGKFYNSDQPGEVGVMYEISGLTGKKKKFPFSMVAGHLLIDKLPEGVARVFREFDGISYIKKDSAEYLYGKWNTAAGNPGGYFWVSRKIESYDQFTTAEPSKSVGTGVLETKIKSWKDREDRVAETIDLPAPFVTLHFYDNGEIDDDSISVYVNDEKVISHRKLSAEPLSLTHDLEKGKTYKITVVADNLGRIPPNTGVVVIRSGDFSKTLYLSADLNKNISFLLKTN